MSATAKVNVYWNGSKNAYLHGVIPLEKLTLVDLVKKFTVFYET
jgi:hypothetical protein